MLNKYVKNQKGLTLIELLAVIVILGIIAAIAVPAIGNVIEKSRNDAVHADATQVLNAAKLYVASEAPTSTVTFDNDTSTTAIDNGLEDYLENIESYSITITVENGEYRYTDIHVEKDEREVTYPTEQNLLNRDVDVTPVTPAT
ncbi:type II secretion system protein [Bacillus sp. JJ1562]|uniref:type II secretion system protein n=1 Tax=Bacillus sp. JJ1562 TaxID=3122960 RepID=UPI0030020039